MEYKDMADLLQILSEDDSSGLNTNELAIRTLKITDAIHDLTRLLKVVRSRCTHHDQTGIKMTYPTGGGFAQCRVCNHEIG